MTLGSSVSPALHMDLFSNESDLLRWGDSDVMFPGMQHYPESSTAQDVDLTGAAGGDLNSIYQTPPHQYEGGPRDRLLTSRLNSSFLSTGYDTERDEGRVGSRPLFVNANALRPKFQPRKPIDHEQFLRDCRIPTHGIREQENVATRVSSRAGDSRSPSTGAQTADDVENSPELSGGLPYHPAYEAAADAYAMHFGSRFDVMDGMLGAVRSPAETVIQTHALYSYVVAAHIDCCKVGAEPADVERMDEAALKHHHLQLKNNNLRPSPEIEQELDSVMAGYLKMLVDLKEKMEESFEKEKKWCDEMYAKLRLLAPSPNPMQLPTGYHAAGNTSAGANEGSTSVIGDRMQESPYWENRNGLLTEEANRAFFMKEWLKSKHDRSEISILRGQCIKKRRQGKHPQTAREVLVEWFERHCEWPYPSEEEKLKLAALTGLETRQINNWFINQRKRHWESHTKDQTNQQIAQELRAFRQVTKCGKNLVDTFYVPLDVLKPSHNGNSS